MTVTRTFTVPEKGVGRKDYSATVEESVVPIIRSYQVNAIAMEQFSLDPGEEKDIDITMIFSASAANHFIGHIDITVDANVLLSTIILSAGLIFFTEYGYQKVLINIPQTLGLSEVTLRITNYGDVAVNGAYSHNGVQGTEEIMPTPE